ncbi:hypothetical protein C8F01DRAFT_1254651 [Mycena amicta]|nr:hypothetical protein C8F01DRAFT_1254651 [Mycena amicta]
MVDPHLPLELEREIFELAAGNHPEMVVQLIRVAHRVLEWTEPFLYRTVRVQNSPAFTSFQRVLLTKPPAFLAASVRHVLFEALRECTPAICIEILSKCPGIINVGTSTRFTGPKALSWLGTLPNLRYLAVSIAELFGAKTSMYGKVIPTEPVFAHVTHLSLHDNMEHTHHLVCPALPGMPRLTHIRLLLRGLPVDAVRDILSGCARLQLLLLTHYEATYDLRHLGYPTNDPRLVFAQASDVYVHFWSDWERGTLGLFDVWALAEETVQKRKRNPNLEMKWIRAPNWVTPRLW